MPARRARTQGLHAPAGPTNQGQDEPGLPGSSRSSNSAGARARHQLGTRTSRTGNGERAGPGYAVTVACGIMPRHPHATRPAGLSGRITKSARRWNDITQGKQDQDTVLTSCPSDGTSPGFLASQASPVRGGNPSGGSQTGHRARWTRRNGAAQPAPLVQPDHPI